MSVIRSESHAIAGFKIFLFKIVYLDLLFFLMPRADLFLQIFPVENRTAILALIYCFFVSGITAALTAREVSILFARRFSRYEEKIIENMATEYERISTEVFKEKIIQMCQEHKS